ncbi:MAG: benzoate-CoA ligase family protein [Alphaproteobacteria bacterium]
MPESSAHADSFARDHLPPPERLPLLDLSGTPETAAYPGRMNCATELIDRQAERFGTRPAYHFGDQTWSYAELLEKANRVARVLAEDLGVVPGNRVMLRSANNPTYAACWLALQKVGAVAVATMPLLRSRELTYIADKARVRLALCDHRLSKELEETKARSAELETIVYWGGGGPGSLEALMAGKSGDFENLDTAADDVALIAFTSGTTGQPKGCMHCHRDILAICDTFSRYVLRPDEGDVFAGSPPLAFTFGLGANLAFPMHAGAATVLFEQFTPQSLMETIARHRVSVLFTAPTGYRAMTGLVPDHDLSSLKKCVSAGETLPAATYLAWERATGIKIIDGLGSTEMLHIFIACAGDDIRPGATGKAIPGYQACVLDDQGAPLGPGEVGRLAVRGPTGCRYLDDAERQATYVQGGWNLTGDAYLVDQEGYFWYQARTDDMIISAGYNIAGPEIEAVLLEHPKVLECAVVGAPDPERGQIVKAFVVLRHQGDATEATAAELQDFVKAEIAPYKYPRSIAFRDALPKTQSGKLQRFRLRESG